jgi:signal transduction histidine kinase/CheY-like chemotaxis protein
MENYPAPELPARREVSCRALDIFFSALPGKGLPPEALTTGMDYPLEYLRNKHNRIDWDNFCVFLENAGKIWTDDEFLAISERFLDSPWVRPFTIISRFLFSVKDVYRFGAQPGTGAVNQLFGVMDGEVIDLGPDHIITVFTLYPGYKYNHYLGLIGLGLQRTAPMLVGLPKATVTMEEFENSSRYDVRLPRGGEGLLIKLRQLVTWPLIVGSAIAELREAYNILQKQNADLQAEIIARKKVEQALEQANIQAEQARLAAETANQTKSLFLANMSHELRTPLNAILGFSQLLTRTHNLAPKQQEYVSIINRSGEHLLTLINDILDFSKIEAGRICLEPQDVDLFFLLDNLENIFRLKTDDKGLSLRFSRDPNTPRFISTDEVKLRQVLINLLHNAIKFTTSGLVSLHLAVVNLPNPHLAHLRFEITDTGPGINPDDLDHLFDAFVQSTSGHSVREGTGLGLAISSQFVQLLGGHLAVSSQVDVGSVFHFEIETPIVEGHHTHPQSPHQIVGFETEPSHLRVLIVDDKWDNRQLLLAMLDPLGLDLEEAADGQQALDLWQSWQPHLILLDIRMPVLDGLEVARRIKATPHGRNTVIIAVSAGSLTAEQRAAPLQAGCDDFISKPFREQEIFEKMGHHLGLRLRYLAPEPTDTSSPFNGDFTPTDLTGLPTDWLEQMRFAATTVDSDLAAQLISRIEPEHPRLAQKITGLVHNFQFDAITNLTESILTEGEHKNEQSKN